MKALVAGLLSVALATPAVAQHHMGHRHFHHGYRGPVVVYRDNWVGPLVGGVVLGAIIADANRPAVVQPPVVVQQPPIVLQQPTVVCTEWKETMQPDGVIVKERTCYQK